MNTKTWYALAAAMIAGCMLLTGCGPSKDVVETVEIAVPTEEIKVVATSTPEEVAAEMTPEAEVEPTATAEEGLSADCTYHAYRLGWGIDYVDAANILNDLFHPDSPIQYTFWDDAAFRDLADQATMEFDPEARVGLWQEAEDILVTEHVAVVPILHASENALVRPEIETRYMPYGQPSFMHWRLPEGQTTLRVASGEPPTLDPHLTGAPIAWAVLGQLMEFPYRHTADGAIEPAGAESYEVSDDGLVYTVHLRQDATWTDGVPVTAQHYADGIIRFLKPETGNDYAWVMYIVQGAEPFHIGEAADPSTLGVRAIDDHTLEITLEQPASYFDSFLASITMAPVRLDVIEQYGDLWSEAENFVGNGPYVLVEWVHEDSIVIEKNPAYWDAEGVTVERVEFSIIDSAAALAAYERGELDLIGYPPEELLRILEEMPDHLRRTPSWPGVYYIGLNLLRPPMDNLNFRKALASSVDRRAICDDILFDPVHIEACGVVPPEMPGYQGCGKVGYAFDVQAAQGYMRAAMDEMGIDDPADVEINLWFNTGNEDIIQAVAEQWETNLGIKVEVSSFEVVPYIDALDACHVSAESGE